MADEWKGLADELLSIVRTQAGSLWNDEDAPFWKEIAEDLARLKWSEINESDPGKKASILHEMSLVETTIKLELARKSLSAHQAIITIITEAFKVLGRVLMSTVFKVAA